MPKPMKSGKWMGIKVNPSSGAEKIKMFDTEAEAKEYEDE